MQEFSAWLYASGFSSFLAGAGCLALTSPFVYSFAGSLAFALGSACLAGSADAIVAAASKDRTTPMRRMGRSNW